jgi:hypothetical protein
MRQAKRTRGSEFRAPWLLYPLLLLLLRWGLAALSDVTAIAIQGFEWLWRDPPKMKLSQRCEAHERDAGMPTT